MYRELKELLHSAEGQSHHVVVIFLDVRGFSTFAGIAESSDTAEFLKSVYIKILDDYFPDADFFKPTGDGLLILRKYDRESLAPITQNTVRLATQLVKDFPTLCENDQMINFDVPAGLGVGLSRGAATSLKADGKVLDFSGRPLNLAARLMDLARPSGVVFDESFGYELLETSIQKEFVQESAYIKGIAEKDPISVYCLEGHAEIPEFNKSPMNQFKRHTEPAETLPLKEWEERGLYQHILKKEPARKDSIIAHIAYPGVRSNGTKHQGLYRFDTERAKYVAKGDQHLARVDYRPSIEAMKSAGVKSPWNVTVTLEFLVDSAAATDAR
jgi:class 3 adenylate cyclase